MRFHQHSRNWVNSFDLFLNSRILMSWNWATTVLHSIAIVITNFLFRRFHLEFLLLFFKTHIQINVSSHCMLATLHARNFIYIFFNFLLKILAWYAKRDTHEFEAMIDAQYKLHSGRKQMFSSPKHPRRTNIERK